MKLPNYHRAVIPNPKITKYLLNLEHPVGKGKAIFFHSFGFSMAKWKDLEQALLKHAASYEVSSTTETAEGIHYVVDGKLQTPDGRNPEVRAVWAIDTGSEIPRFITAHPLKRTKGRNND